MAFDEEQLAQISNVNGFGLYRYDTLDSLATVSTSGYINNPGDHVGLVAGDFIDVVVWNTSIRFGTMSVIERHVVTQVNTVTGDVGLLSLVNGFNRAIFASGQWGYWSAHIGSGSTVRDHGTFSSTVDDGSSSLVTSDDGLALRQNTTAVIADDASIFGVAKELQFNTAPSAVSKFRLVQTTDIRFFAGLQNGAVLSVDSGSGDVVGVHFSTDRGDTNLQFLRRAAGTQVLVDSGLAPDTSAHHVTVDVASITSVLVRIMDAAFVEQASTTFTTGLPAGSIALATTTGLETRVAAVKSIDQFFTALVQRSP